MQKDFKIGTALGLLIVAVVSLWLAVQPRLSVKARMAAIQPADNPEITQQSKTQSQQPPVTISSLDASAQRKTADSNQVKDIRQQIALNTEQSGKPSTLTADTVQKPKPGRFHIVQKGDTLSGISYKYYDTAVKWQKILDANRSTLKNPNKLTPGSKLIIPE